MRAGNNQHSRHGGLSSTPISGTKKKKIGRKAKQLLNTQTNGPRHEGSQYPNETRFHTAILNFRVSFINRLVWSLRFYSYLLSSTSGNYLVICSVHQTSYARYLTMNTEIYVEVYLIVEDNIECVTI